MGEDRIEQPSRALEARVFSLDHSPSRTPGERFERSCREATPTFQVGPVPSYGYPGENGWGGGRARALLP